VLQEESKEPDSKEEETPTNSNNATTKLEDDTIVKVEI
jgi:hypothetical protein